MFNDGQAKKILHDKLERDSDWFQMIQKHRDFELEQMRQNFKSADFLQAMRNFVFKLKPDSKQEDSGLSVARN